MILHLEGRWGKIFNVFDAKIVNKLEMQSGCTQCRAGAFALYMVTLAQKYTSHLLPSSTLIWDLSATTQCLLGGFLWKENPMQLQPQFTAAVPLVWRSRFWGALRGHTCPAVRMWANEVVGTPGSSGEQQRISSRLQPSCYPLPVLMAGGK